MKLKNQNLNEDGTYRLKNTAYEEKEEKPKKKTRKGAKK